MSRFAVLLLAAVLLSACAKAAPRVQPGEPKAPPAQAVPVHNAGGSDPAAAPASIETYLPVPGPLPEGMRRVELPAGQPIGEPGLYFMDVSSGHLEGWIMPPFDHSRAMGWAQSTEDHRWITFSLEGRGYLIRRSDGKAFSYDPERVTVRPGPGLFLLEPRVWRNGDGSRVAVLNGEMQLVSTFALHPGMPGSVQFLFSPDGRKLAVTDTSVGGGLSLVDIATGQVTRLAGFESGSSSGLAALPALGEFVVTQGEYQKPLRLERYDWQGRPTGRKQVDGWSAWISDDGRTLAYLQSLGHYGQAVVVQAWDQEQPLFRVAGAVWSSWLAGGSGLVVQTSRGWQLVTGTGEMRAAPHGGEPRWRPFEWYWPSPDRPDLFVSGTKVFDRSGRILQEVKIADGAHARVQSAGWGPSSREVHLVVVPPLGKGFEMEPWTNFVPRVQRAPFPGKHPLQVRDPLGECLNLREQPALKGRIVRCLPTGTRLALDLKPDQYVSTAWEDQMVWLAVETERGERGWVAVSTGSITYAD